MTICIIMAFGEASRRAVANLWPGVSMKSFSLVTVRLFLNVVENELC